MILISEAKPADFSVIREIAYTTWPVSYGSFISKAQLDYMLEKFYNNVYFICTTHKISKIESPIKSRFSLIRLRLFTNEEITLIFNKYLNSEQVICNNRNIIFCIFL